MMTINRPRKMMGENFLLKRALVVVDQSDQIKVLDEDRDENLHGDKNMLIEEKLTEIANTLGISMEGQYKGTEEVCS